KGLVLRLPAAAESGPEARRPSIELHLGVHGVGPVFLEMDQVHLRGLLVESLLADPILKGPGWALGHDRGHAFDGGLVGKDPLSALIRLKDLGQKGHAKSGMNAAL